MKIAIAGLTYAFYWSYQWDNSENKEKSDYTTHCNIINAETKEVLAHAEVRKHPKKRRENRENARKASLSKCLYELFPGDRRTAPLDKEKRGAFWGAYLNRPRVSGTPKAKQEVPSDAVQPTE